MKKLLWCLIWTVAFGSTTWAWEPSTSAPIFSSVYARSNAVLQCQQLIGMTSIARSAFLAKNPAIFNKWCFRDPKSLSCQLAIEVIAASKWSVSRLNDATSADEATTTCRILAGAPIEVQ